jgi:Ca-activated chloride channel homolog
VQEASSKEKYLVGKYDVEVLCLPRMTFKDVSIDQSKLTTIQLPQPGKLIVNCQLQDYYADIYQMVRNEMTWVCKLPVEKRTHQLIIQPGDYKIVYRSKGATRSSHTFERLFKVTSGMATNIILN